MIIIVVGPDGAGKSTLVKKISEQTGYLVKHMDKPSSEDEALNMYWMYKDLISANTNFILDRAWYCEMVYGKIMREGSYISNQQMLELEKLVVCNGGGLIIHCTDETEKLWHRCKERGEDYIKSFNQLDEIVMSYEGLLHHMPHELPVLRYVIDENLS